MKFERQVSSICKVSFFQNRIISRIQKDLSVDNAKILIHAFVTCRLDNGNALQCGVVLLRRIFLWLLMILSMFDKPR